MGGRVGKTTNWVDDVEDARVDTAQRQQWGEITGTVKSFNSQTQTATIQPDYKPKFNGKAITMPELLEVPVRFARTGAGAITQPVPEGTKVSLRPQMRSTENYHTDGGGEASDSRMFNLSDMEAHLTGGESLTDPIQNFDNENIHVRAGADGTKGLKVDPKTGKTKIEGPEGDSLALNNDALELIAEGFTKLGTESTLTHRVRYGEIGAALTAIVTKLRGNQLP
jgi:hypothetical protein